MSYTFRATNSSTAISTVPFETLCSINIGLRTVLTFYLSGTNTLAAGSTIFDFYVNLDTMAWEAWAVPTWEYPIAPAEVDFQSLLVPTVDSTRALAVIHHLQVG